MLRLVIVAAAVSLTACKSTNNAGTSTLRDDGAPSADGATRINGECKLVQKRQKRTLTFRIAPNGAGSHAVTFSIQKQGAAATQFAPLEGFEEADVVIEGEEVYVGGAGDGDAGFLNIVKGSSGTYTGVLNYPNSPSAGTGLKGDGADYDVTCTGSAQAAQVVQRPVAANRFLCRMAAKRHKPYLIYTIDVNGNGANVGYMQFASYAQSLEEMVSPQVKALPQFTAPSRVIRSKKKVYVEGDGDGDGGYFNLTQKSAKSYTGTINFPNSAPIQGFKGDGRRYNLVCDAGNVPAAPASSFPAAMASLEESMGNYAENFMSFTTKRIDTIAANPFDSVKGNFSSDARAELKRNWVKFDRNGMDLASFFADWLADDGSAPGMQQSLFNAGFDVYKLEAQLEDGIQIIYGVLVVDPATKKAFLAFSNESA